MGNYFLQLQLSYQLIVPLIGALQFEYIVVHQTLLEAAEPRLWGEVVVDTHILTKLLPQQKVELVQLVHKA